MQIHTSKAEARLQKTIHDLWEKYASADKHGYKDLMRQDAFDDACRELLAKLAERT